MHEIQTIITKLYDTQALSEAEFITLLYQHKNDEIRSQLASLAREVAQRTYGNKVYTRGLIEFSNYCKNDCYYCGIRRSNGNADRYRLTKEDILECCKEGYELGFRTFVLQGGEDLSFTDEVMVDLVSSIRQGYPDCAITLSLGEREKENFQKYYDAGANRYLLRHETYDDEHYRSLHPEELNPQHRKQCLYDLKEIGFQVGTGIMVGSPNQTLEMVAKDLLFIKQLNPQMVGIGPFIPQHDTPFAKEAQGSLELTLTLLSILRLLLPNALLPSTTALGTIDKQGREKGILAGANVVMPNLSPIRVRKKYQLYDNKICTGEEAAECRFCLQNRMKKIGYEIVVERGDYKQN